MNCSQCGAELPPSSTSCSRCGLSRQSTSDTPSTSAKTPAFSYLPAGTPPWPTTIPDKLPFIATAEREAKNLALPENKVAAKPKPPTRNVLAMAGLIILIPLVGGLLAFGSYFINNLNNPTIAANNPNVPQSLPTVPASSTTGATQQLPPPAAFKNAANTPALNISVQYPADWTEGAVQQNQVRSLIEIYPTQIRGMEIIFSRLQDSFITTAKISNPDEINAASIEAQKTDFQNIQVISAPNQEQTIGTEKWIERHITMTNQSGVKIHYVTITTKRANVYYQIEIYAVDEIYEQAMQKYMQPILKSVEFVS